MGLYAYYSMSNGNQPVTDAKLISSNIYAKEVENSTFANLGSTGRIVTKNINEKLAMEQVMSNPLAEAEKFTRIKMTDSRWLGTDRQVKMQNSVRLSDGTKINIHFVFNEIFNLVDNFKFK